MKFSEAQKAHLLQRIIDGLYKEDLVDLPDDDESQAMRSGRRAFQEWEAELAAVHTEVEKKIRNLKRQVSEGSPEWSVLFGKYFEEEMNRRGR